jgi:hypothetical protein
MPASLPILPSDRGLAENVVTMSKWAMQRLDAISFFALIILLSAAATQRIWNAFQKDFPRWPRLTYWRALGLILVWGCLFIVVLTMISGARELMTPGAWERQGATYRLTNSAAKDSDSAADRERETRLVELRTQLWRYAATHLGKFPSQDAKASPIPPALWQLPDLSDQRFQYVAEQSASESGELLAYEPEFGRSTRLVLLTDGSIVRLSSAEIAKLQARVRK